MTLPDLVAATQREDGRTIFSILACVVALAVFGRTVGRLSCSVTERLRAPRSRGHVA
jgi:hypothetical protein